jgi:hypothetical protein
VKSSLTPIQSYGRLLGDDAANQVPHPPPTVAFDVAIRDDRNTSTRAVPLRRKRRIQRIKPVPWLCVRKKRPPKS